MLDRFLGCRLCGLAGVLLAATLARGVESLPASVVELRPSPTASSESPAPGVAVERTALAELVKLRVELAKAETEARRADPELERLEKQRREAKVLYEQRLAARPEIQELRKRVAEASEKVRGIYTRKRTSETKE